MSAVAAVVRTDGGADADLAVMLDVMAAWGPDGRRTWSGDGVALGHLLRVDTARSRNAVTPLEQVDRRGRLVVAADARLHAGIGTAVPDEVRLAELLVAYARSGATRGLADSGGEFAGVAWDTERRRLLMVRDHFGQRPLFLARNGDRLAVASDQNALLALDWVDDEPDVEFRAAEAIGVIGYLPTRAHFLATGRVPPASVMTWDGPAEPRVQVWWRAEDDVGRHEGSLEEQVEELRVTIDEAVARAIDDVRPIGAHVSGGLDSTAYAISAARQLSERGSGLVAGFSWSPSPDEVPLRPETDSVRFGDVDERRRVMAVGEQFGFPIVWTPMTAEMARAEEAREPGREGTVSTLFEQVVVAQAAERGIGVLLSGWGSDELPAFNGRGYFAELLWRGRWPTFVRAVRARSEVFEDNSWRWVAHQLLQPLARGPLRGRAVGAVTTAGLLEAHGAAPDVTKRLTGWDADAAIAQTSVRTTQIALLRRGHLEARLLSWALLEHGSRVTYRYPALDRELVRLALRLSSDMYFHVGWKRWGFRSAMPDLPRHDPSWHRHKDDPVHLRRFDSVCR